MSNQIPRHVVESVLRPGSFFVTPPGRLRIEYVPREEASWEIFRGHLLERTHTRRRAPFASWHVWLDADGVSGGAPLISLKWHLDERRLYVTRNLLVHGFEAYEEAPGVIGSRPAEKWIEELVATFDPSTLPPEELSAELTMAVRQTVLGTSRLPITSLESPLPGFSLGQLAYVPELGSSGPPYDDPAMMFATALAANLSPGQLAHALEGALRSTVDARWENLLDAIDADLRLGAARRGRWPAMLRALFNGVALSPYTRFVERLLRLLGELSTAERLGSEIVVDVVSYMLRNLGRHLTAFDLTVFHNFGANYPDALLLDGLLKVYLQLLEQQPELAAESSGSVNETRLRVRRRALRQACLLRKQYEGHRVPDAPTSMGENSRVLPAPHSRVPDEQILQPAKRRRQLFAGESVESLLGAVTRPIFEQSLADLASAAELRELGTALFLDRPLGVWKEPGEVDRTPLVSYVAFSRAIAKRRLASMTAYGWITDSQRAAFQASLGALEVHGLAAAEIAPRERPGVVSLADAGKVAADFQLLHSTTGSLTELLSHYDLAKLAVKAPAIADWLQADERQLLVAHAPADRPPTLRFYGPAADLRLELAFASGQNGLAGYQSRRGAELPVRLQIVQWREHAGSADANAVAQLWLDLR